MGEKRKFLRFDVLVNAICRKSGQEKKLEVNNFSREGLGVLSSESLQEGENLDIELMIPGDNVPIMLQGEVAWACGPAGDGNQHRGGVRFKSISNNDRSKILEYIYRKWIQPAKA
ncbi:MAG: PilZ domain-containing protein [Candidatus Omnitrophica bacterium]|nr:PilZ domain-containing protein [Candidatus Omnitrophota bacterium]MDD5488804.1 PilZ domain-containing protein [Candidatus Omnitrophota bacterium]